MALAWVCITHVNTFNLTLVAGFWAFFLFAPLSQANTTAVEIEQSVERAISEAYLQRLPESRLEIQVSPVNPQLQLAPCQAPLEIQLPFSTGQRVTARVNCAQPQWSLFVSAQIRQFLPVVVSTRPLARNSRVQSSDLRLLEQDITRLGNDYYTQLDDLVGMQVRRPIGSDQVISPRQLEAALAVSRGERVALEAQRGGLTIRTLGVALEDGRLGQQIRVRNESSGNEVHAMIIAPGVVRVP
ncbi:flagellar basal body P-ring formation protein FlgA [Nitrincola tapanii]|uniref:Flagella basal body P-ring formation protein FlgA n=1 Tax=Nitrincola tapanii TaxID=1708751 RepID=A0A5A9W705_9GAMM|nr:flagellar basal body P-ring formation protein FlgA [Nitrincola tapanii]